MAATECASGVGTGHASELLAVLEDVAATLGALPVPSPTGGSREAWAQAIRTSQQILNIVSAVQDEAIVALAAIEPVELEDGTDAEVHKAPGHVALEAAAIVSGALEVTANHAEDRVRDAVRRAADGPAGTSTCTGLGGLHDAMRAGVLDGYRARVVEHELELAPPEVAEAVIESLGEHLAHETGTQLRRRTRRLLARISPDLLRQRAKRAREECGLRRWVGEPGVDQWEGSFPSEDAAKAWAAIDARARELIADGTFDRIERARSQALIDLVLQSATVTTVITLTVPATQVTETPVTPVTGASGAQAAAPGVTAAVSAGVEQRRVGVADRGFVEVATGRGTEQVLVAATWLTGQLAASYATTIDDKKRSSGKADKRGEVRVETRTCDPVTGALLSDLESGAYRPPERIAALVRQRDGRCRFPGCHVAARYTDLDHVRPWPTGPTTAGNLICLCRRHHRIKQRPGWRAVLHPDGTVEWTDPTGRQRTTLPVDALHTVSIPGTPETEAAPATPATEAAPATPATPTTATAATAATADTVTTRTDAEWAPFSHLEFALEHLLGADLANLPTRRGRRAAQARAGASVTVIRPADTITVHDPHRPCRRVRPRTQTPDPDLPPF